MRSLALAVCALIGCASQTLAPDAAPKTDVRVDTARPEPADGASALDGGAVDTQLPVISCNVDCPLGPCAVRAGAPTVLATSASDEHVGAIAVGPDALYYGTLAKDARAGGQLRKVTLATGADALVVAGVQVRQLRLDSAGSVYYVVDAIQSTAQRLFMVDAAGASSARRREAARPRRSRPRSPPRGPSPWTRRGSTGSPRGRAATRSARSRSEGVAP